MSGSSLDGLDIAYCNFEIEKTTTNQIVVHDWEILEAATIAFSESWQARLSQLPTQTAIILAKTHTYLGHYLGAMVTDFIQRYNIEPDFIATHGHTIFHEPAGRMTLQIGDGSAMAAITGYPVISNFRNQDIAIDGDILSQLVDDKTEIPNQLCTLVEHIAHQIAFAIKQVIRKENIQKEQLSLLATGGGAFNTFLMERLQANCKEVADLEVIIPNPAIIQFKEAALMAWMGVMRVENVPNVLKTVTGARRDTINGAIHQGWKKLI